MAAIPLGLIWYAEANGQQMHGEQKVMIECLAFAKQS